MNKSYLSNIDPEAIDNLYRQFLNDPLSVDISWQKFFEGFDFARTSFTSDKKVLRGDAEKTHKEFQVMNLINGYRIRGHLFTKTNPVRERRKYFPTLDIENFGLLPDDMELVFHAGTAIGTGPAKLKDIISLLEQTYCASIGAEYKYIRDPEVVTWLEHKMESVQNIPSFTLHEKRRMLHKLNQAVAFENFIHTKFVGQKRFSLEGCETLIPAMDAVISIGAEMGIREIVIGMAHRGRLNMLANILGKTYEDIFSEFDGIQYDDSLFAGDVKYHLGYSGTVTTFSNKKVHVSVTPNPSHLEAVDPVVQGIVRAKIDKEYTENEIAPILIHGDAAIAGQGIVYEVIQMSLLRGYKTGGTIHLILNNQVGFTTNYLDGRSSTYCTDVAKVTLSPVFHVNADDVEALVYTIGLALQYRQKFHKDVFIDILGYRKYGHNEGDEPRFTQPLLYKAIASHPDARQIYNEKLLSQGAVEVDLAREMEKSFRGMLQDQLNMARENKISKSPPEPEGLWNNIRAAVPEDFEQSPDTGVTENLLIEIGDKITALPQHKPFLNKTIRLCAERSKMLHEKKTLDWAMGELLAYGTLLSEGFPVRISGQDVERGTFSHRHAVMRVEDSEEEYIPLNNLGKQAPFYIYNSLLSEYGVLGFEYGYALSSPDSLVVWEAQFGDFDNGAQIIIDQYLSSAEDKWNRMNGLVLFLPHGYEGQGAEHSSARLERFLNLCAEDNIQIVNCTTPANFFHVLRRQLHRPFRKPLVIFTPKSLLRHPRCVSSLNDFIPGTVFKEVYDDASANAKDITRLIFCSGKIFYELMEAKEKQKIINTAVIRIEQIYPFPRKQISMILKKYTNAQDFLWVQEEPENAGAWGYIMRTFSDVPLKLIARQESASPATGSHKQHESEQELIIKKAFALKDYKIGKSLIKTNDVA